MDSLRLLFLAALWISVAAGAGYTILRLAVGWVGRGVETGVLSLLVGYGLGAYLIAGLGIAGWVGPAASWTVFGVLLAVALQAFRTIGIPSPPSIWQRVRDSLRWVWWQGDDGRLLRWVLRSALLVIGAVGALSLIAALAPPTEWDSLTYHLAAPKYYLDQGAVTFVPYINWTNPFTAEMWNLLGLAVGGDRLPQLFNWAVMFVGMGAVYMLADRLGGRQVGVVAAAMYITSPHIFSMAGSAKSDLAWLALCVGSVHVLLRYWETEEVRLLLLAAVLMGLTLSTKTHGLFWAGAVGVVFAAREMWERRNRLRPALARVCLFGLVAFAVGSLWWIRNWLAGGDPVWPYGFPLFGSEHWSQALYEKYSVWRAGPGQDLGDLILAPWNLFMHQDRWLYGHTIPLTPLVLAFLPAVALGWRGRSRAFRRSVLLLTAVAALYFLAWFFTYQQTRYLFPALSVLMVPAAAGACGALRLRWSRWAAAGALWTVFGMFTGAATLYGAQFVPVVTGEEPKRAFLERYVSFYGEVAWMNHNLPPDARVLFFHLKPFYLERDFVLGRSNVWPVDGDTTPEEYLRLLADRGVTHLFVTERTWGDSESSDLTRIHRRLVSGGSLVLLRHNPCGTLVESRIFGERKCVETWVFRVEYGGSRTRTTPASGGSNSPDLAGP